MYTYPQNITVRLKFSVHKNCGAIAVIASTTYNVAISEEFFSFKERSRLNFKKNLSFNDMHFGASLSTKSLSNPEYEFLKITMLYVPCA